MKKVVFIMFALEYSSVDLGYESWDKFKLHPVMYINARHRPKIL